MSDSRARLIVGMVLKDETGALRTLSLLDSQSVLPSALLLVEGGTRAAAVSIEEHLKKLPNVRAIARVLYWPDSTIPQARNLILDHAGNGDVAFLDGGCLPISRNWLAMLTAPVADVVAGTYVPASTSVSVNHLARGCMLQPTSDGFLPSCRNVLLRGVHRLGRFREDLAVGEDTEFFARLKENGVAFAVAEDAAVSWDVSANVPSFIRKLASYGTGDARSGFAAGKYTLRLIVALFALVVFVWNPPLAAIGLMVACTALSVKRTRKPWFLLGVLVGELSVLWGWTTGRLFGKVRL